MPIFSGDVISYFNHVLDLALKSHNVIVKNGLKFSNVD